MKRQTIKEQMRHYKECFRETDKEYQKLMEKYLSLEKDFDKLQDNFNKNVSINTELKAEVDSLRTQNLAYSHSLEHKRGKINAYEKVLKIEMFKEGEDRDYY